MSLQAAWRQLSNDLTWRRIVLLFHLFKPAKNIKQDISVRLKAACNYINDYIPKNGSNPRSGYF